MQKNFYYDKNTEVLLLIHKMNGKGHNFGPGAFLDMFKNKSAKSTETLFIKTAALYIHVALQNSFKRDDKIELRIII